MKTKTWPSTLFSNQMYDVIRDLYISGTGVSDRGIGCEFWFSPSGRVSDTMVNYEKPVSSVC